ncbi:MAG TPA: hypothetical protein VM097_10545 [Mycobacteriales bacterium]|nr:hypothetical protein [Mycobacteriales bacterium]
MRRLAAALLLVAVGRLASPAAVPVYDGVGAPDEPYKYVGRGNAPVSSVSATASVVAGAAESLQVKSAESGPQVLVDLGAGAFAASTRTVTLTATAVAGDGTSVPQGRVDGNVYRVTATAGARLLPDRAQGFLFLRAAVMTRPDPVVVHRSTSTEPWEKVKTVRAGRDVLSTPFRALGDYAVVRLSGATPLSDSGGLSATRLALLGGGVLLLLLLTVLVLRRPTTPEGPDDQTGPTVT